MISETLLVIPTVGIQSSVKYVCGKENEFIPWTNIDDVIINEVVKMVRIFKQIPDYSNLCQNNP